MDDEAHYVDQQSLISYIRTALAMDGVAVEASFIEHILELEMEYLQHQGLVEREVDDPRPEG